MDGLDIMERPAQLTSENVRSYFKAVARDRGLAHIAYYAHTIPGRGPEESVIWTTYSPEWVKHYFQNSYFRIDPVVGIDRTSVLPVDWSALDRSGKAVQRFFGEASEFGVGRNGLAIPVRGPRGDRAIFAVTSNESEPNWIRQRTAMMRDLVIMAQHVHQHAMTGLEVYGNSEREVRLAPRELECLRWAAAGKTVQDIAVILSISERVVRAYLDTSRHKLNALNIAHTVARAVSMGMIATG